MRNSCPRLVGPQSKVAHTLSAYKSATRVSHARILIIVDEAIMFYACISPLEYVTLGCPATPSASSFHPDFLHDVPVFKEMHLPSLVLADFV